MGRLATEDYGYLGGLRTRRSEAKEGRRIRRADQLDAVVAAVKILGREVAAAVNGLKEEKRKMSAAARAKDWEGTRLRWAKFSAAKARGKKLVLPERGTYDLGSTITSHAWVLTQRILRRVLASLVAWEGTRKIGRLLLRLPTVLRIRGNYYGIPKSVSSPRFASSIELGPDSRHFGFVGRFQTHRDVSEPRLVQ